MDEIKHVTIVTDDRDVKDYRRGDIGQPLLAVSDDRWMIACPMCGTMTTLQSGDVVKHADGTVSTTSPLLYCHGRDALRRYRIEHNRVWWAE